MVVHVPFGVTGSKVPISLNYSMFGHSPAHLANPTALGPLTCILPAVLVVHGAIVGSNAIPHDPSNVKEQQYWKNKL